jgi:hypothetical protein
LLSEVSQARGRVAGLGRTIKTGERQPDDPDYIEACRDLNAANLKAAVLKALAKAPPPSDRQLDAIAALLRAGGGDHAA